MTQQKPKGTTPEEPFRPVSSSDQMIADGTLFSGLFPLSMEQVDFITTESGDDLIVSFAIRGADPSEIRSLTLLRTPKYEFALDESQRGVHVSDEDCEDDEENLLKAVEFRGEQVRIICQNSDHQLDCNRVCEEELASAKRILDSMNFDNRFRIRIE